MSGDVLVIQSFTVLCVCLFHKFRLFASASQNQNLLRTARRKRGKADSPGHTDVLKNVLIMKKNHVDVAGDAQRLFQAVKIDPRLDWANNDKQMNPVKNNCSTLINCDKGDI